MPLEECEIIWTMKNREILEWNYGTDFLALKNEGEKEKET